MIPRRILPPADPLITLEDAKAHCRVDGPDSDLLMQGYIDAAMAYLDGYRGVLGRCIMAQDWEIDLACAGRHRLPLPDAMSASARDAAGDPVAVELHHDARGSSVTIAVPATVSFKAALPEELLPSLRVAALLLIGHWFENREAVSERSMTSLPMAVDALIAPIRWYAL